MDGSMRHDVFGGITVTAGPIREIGGMEDGIWKSERRNRRHDLSDGSHRESGHDESLSRRHTRPHRRVIDLSAAHRDRVTMAPTTNSNETYCTFTLAQDVTAGGLPSEAVSAEKRRKEKMMTREILSCRTRCGSTGRGVCILSYPFNNLCIPSYKK